MIDDARSDAGMGPADDFLSALDEQLASPETPEVKAEMERLTALGVERDEARKAMAIVLSIHIVRMLRQKKPFDYDAYLAELRRLPKFEFPGSV